MHMYAFMRVTQRYPCSTRKDTQVYHGEHNAYYADTLRNPLGTLGFLHALLNRLFDRLADTPKAALGRASGAA